MGDRDLPAPLFHALLRLVARVGSYVDADRAVAAIVRGLVEELGVRGAALWRLDREALGPPIASGEPVDEVFAREALNGAWCDARGCAWPLRPPGSREVLGVLAVSGEPGDPARRVIGMLAGRCAQILVDGRHAAAQRLLLHGLSHELRAPLQSMLGHVDLLRAGALGELRPAQREAVDAVARGAERVLAVARDVLQAARIDAGFERPIVGEVLLRDLLVGEVELVLSAADPAERRVAIDCPGDLRVVTDGAKVARILTNLVTNALKYGGGGEVRVAARAAEGGGCVIEVSDAGPGIPHAEQERIFEEFVRLGADDCGSGLGLAISRRLAVLLGGRLALDSEPGRGSRFRLELPTRPPGAELGAQRGG